MKDAFGKTLAVGDVCVHVFQLGDCRAQLRAVRVMDFTANLVRIEALPGQGWVKGRCAPHKLAKVPPGWLDTATP